MSTARSAPAATPTAMLDRAACEVIAIDRDPDAIAAGQALAERYAPRLRLIEGRFGDMARAAVGRGRRRRSTAWRSISAFRPCSSTRPSAASRSAPPVRSTCAWTKSGQSAADLVNDGRRDRARRHHLALRRGAEEPPRRARHRRARAATSASRPPASWPRSCAAPSGPHGQGRERSRDAHLPGAAHRRERRAGRARARPRRRRAGAGAGRPSRRRLLPFAGGPRGQGIRARPRRPHAGAVAPRAAARRASAPPPCATSRASRCCRRPPRSPPIRARARRACASPRSSRGGRA